MIDVKIKFLSEKVECPQYSTDGSLGMDLSAVIDEPVTIKAGERALIPLGFAIQIPDGWGAFVFPRSGLSSKKGINLSNCVGVIDPDYTGEVKASLSNTSKEDYTVNPGDRVAQLVFLPVEKAKFVVVDDLDDTDRGAGGFGSTGK